MLTLFLIISTFWQTVFSQNEEIGRSILKKLTIKSVSDVKLNENGFFLELKEKEAKKIAKKVLYNVYGKFNIIKQKPFYIYNVDDFWIFKGSLKKGKRGGVFTLIINSKNRGIKYLSHGR